MPLTYIFCQPPQKVAFHWSKIGGLLTAQFHNPLGLSQTWTRKLPPNITVIEVGFIYGNPLSVTSHNPNIIPKTNVSSISQYEPCSLFDFFPHYMAQEPSLEISFKEGSPSSITITIHFFKNSFTILLFPCHISMNVWPTRNDLF